MPKLARSSVWPLIALALAGAVQWASVAAPDTQTWKPERQGSYGKITRDALDRLLAASEKAQEGDLAAAKPLLKGMQDEIDSLSRATAFFREQANREFDRCTVQVQDLDNRVVDLENQEREFKAKIDKLNASVAGLQENTRLTQAQINSLNQSLDETQAQLAERRRKLAELEKWWWVPFYNTYLGIRTLVDNDIGNYNSLTNTFRDAHIQLAQTQRELQSANALKAGLNKEIGDLSRTQAGLKELTENARTDLGYMKETALFLSEATAFWGRLDFLLTQNVTGSVTAATDIANLRATLTKENSPPLFNNQRERPLVELYESLIAFADTLDQGNNFLLAEGSQFCGGPPRSRTGPNVSSKCNIETITSYYEIVDPKTCTFRYLNPPGCPPRPRITSVTDQALSAARSRGIWSRAPGQNWIGRARCSSPQVKYFGKVESADACERSCMASENCASWTFNNNNAYMGNESMHECWGALPGFTPNKSNWSGFTSGGISVR